MRLIKCYMTQSTWYKGAANGTPKGVLWHSTGANNPNISRYVQPDDKAADRAAMIALIGKNKYGNDWNHIDRDAGVHAWIGKLADGSIATVEAGPYEKKAWGCGDKASRLKNGWSLNETHIQFEICEGDLNDKEYFEKVYQEAVEYTAMLCKKYGWDPMGTFTYRGESIPVITDHAGSHAIGHGGNHGDVGHWFRRYLGSDYLNEIRRDVATQIAFDELGTAIEILTPKDTIKEGDLVKITGTKYYSGKTIPSWVKNQNWFVKSVSGDRAVIDKNEKGTNSICSPINVKDIALVNAPVAPQKPAEQPKPAEPTPTPTPTQKPAQAPSTPAKKSIEEIAKEVINGKWGNGQDRKNRLEAAGYDYSQVQTKVNELCGAKPQAPAKKSVDEIAREVIQGKWGNGADRKKRLTAAGYDYSKVQARVNQLCK